MSYNSAWLIKQKIMHVFLQAEQHNPLAGVIHVDDGCFGGKRQGIRGRGTHGKTPLITALSRVNGRPAQLKRSIIPNFTRSRIGSWVQTTLSGPYTVYSDSLSGFAVLQSDAITHKPVNTSAHPAEKTNCSRQSTPLWVIQNAIYWVFIMRFGWIILPVIWLHLRGDASTGMIESRYFETG